MTVAPAPPFLSVIVPSYNEARRIGRTLARITEYLRQTGCTYEVIVVDDGSTDGTVDTVQSVMRQDPRLRLLRNERNRGKGHAVRRGVLASQGRYVLFSDADLSTPIEEWSRMLPALQNGAGVVIASRRRHDSHIDIRQPWHREKLLGGLLSLLVRRLVVPGIRDTQCGFKGFTQPAARLLFAQQTLDGFAFDIELLYLARKHGLAIAEIGVRWTNDPRSRVHPVRDSLRMLRDVIRIKYNDRRGFYVIRDPAQALSSTT